MIRRSWLFALCMWLLLLPISILAQDLNLYGKFELVATEIDLKEISRIKSKCFFGFGFPSCRPVYQDEEFTRAENLDYYNQLDSMYGANYCVQCCGKQPDHLDVWDLYCDLDVVTARQSNDQMYGVELRLSANQYDGDMTIITCPVKRKICNYDSAGNYVDCPGQGADVNKLVGYTAHIEVNKRDEYFSYWRGVRSCYIETEESVLPPPGYRFRETIILHHYSTFMDLFDLSKLALALITIYCMSYGVLYYFRVRRCLYCLNKLVFSTEMCHRCKFVGADPPDPILIAALAEKGFHIQGQYQEAFPGSAKAVAWYIRQKKRLRKSWFRFRRLHPEQDMIDEEATLANSIAADVGLQNNTNVVNSDTSDTDILFGSVSVDSTGAESKDAGGQGDPLSSRLQTETPSKLQTQIEEGRKNAYSEAAAANAEAGSGVSVNSETSDLTIPASPPLLNFFPFKWKYPWWAVKYLGYSNKKKKKVPHVNPNIINMPKHIIYAAVGHPNPPAADENYLEYRKNVFLDRLGYIPEKMDDDPMFAEPIKIEPKGAIAIEVAKSLHIIDKHGNKVPFWQAAHAGPRVPPSMPPETGIIAWLSDHILCYCKQSQESKLRNAFIKHKNKKDLPPVELMLKTVCVMCCCVCMLFAMLLYGLNLDISYLLS